MSQVRSICPNVPVVVRTADEVDLDKLRQAGAAEVVPESVESSLMLASHALALVGFPCRASSSASARPRRALSPAARSLPGRGSSP
jgi:voltage-gated potassium channel Kch